MTPETQVKKIDALVAEMREKGALLSSEKTGIELYREGLDLLRRNGVGKVSRDRLTVVREDLLNYFAAPIEDRMSGN